MNRTLVLPWNMSAFSDVVECLPFKQWNLGSIPLPGILF